MNVWTAAASHTNAGRHQVPSSQGSVDDWLTLWRLACRLAGRLDRPTRSYIVMILRVVAHAKTRYPKGDSVAAP
jgi:hypothetical protein